MRALDLLEQAEAIQCKSVTVHDGSTTYPNSLESKVDVEKIAALCGVPVAGGVATLSHDPGDFKSLPSGHKGIFGEFSGWKTMAFLWAMRVRYAWRPAATRVGDSKPVAAARLAHKNGGVVLKRQKCRNLAQNLAVWLDCG